MGLADALNPFGFIKAIIEPAKDLVDEFVHSGEEKAEAHLKLQELEYKAKAQVLKSEEIEMQARTQIQKLQLQIILEEAKGSWYQKAWRPALIGTYMGILINNYIVLPYYPSIEVLTIPDWLWYVFAGLVGIYVPSRTIEKGIKGWLKTKVGSPDRPNPPVDDSQPH